MSVPTKMQSHCLINGVFLPDDARQLLMTLINDKINFHQRSDWSSRERLGSTSSPGARRIGELIATREELAKLLANAERRGCKLVINCNIEISMMQTEHTESNVL